VSILAICPAGEQACLTPTPHRALRAGDKLLVTGRRERVKQLTQLGAEVVSNGAWEQELATSKINLVEVILAPRSAAEGQTLKEIRFREKYGVSVVALWRGGRPYRTDVGDRELRFGDALLVYGTPADFNVLRTDPDFLLLTELEERSARRCNEWLAAGTMVLALAATGLNILPIAEAMMLGALFMIVTGCLNLDEAYRAVEWRVIFLIAGMLAASIAVTRSGAADWLANVLVGGLANWGVLVLMGGSLLLGALLAQVMSGQVAVVILIPIVISAAQQLGANPRAIAVAVAMGCNMTFLSPTSHPANVFVMGPGGYSFRDFLKVGAPLTLLLITTVLVLLPAFWPLR
jgi:di/tricarboxylate transporter